jgi:hypothetical protein
MAFLYQEPFANLPSDFAKISPESLTAFYEISFSAANIQRLNLESRLEDIRNRSSRASGTGATVYLEDKADGKSSKNRPMLPAVRKKRWDFWSTSFGDFVHVDCWLRFSEFTPEPTDPPLVANRGYQRAGHTASHGIFQFYPCCPTLKGAGYSE